MRPSFYRLVLVILALLSLLFVSKGFSQDFTAVVATVVDPHGTPYQSCRGTVNLINLDLTEGDPAPNLNGYTFPTQVPISSCDSFGHFAINLASNTAVKPGPTTWDFTICNRDATVCFHYRTTVNGAGPVDLSSALSGASAIIPILGSDPNKVSRSGDSMTGPLTLPGRPTNPLHAATKDYVDSSFPVHETGDIFGYGNSQNQRIPVGADGLCLKADSTSILGVSYQECAGSSPLTTKGDLAGFSTVPARIPLGLDGQCLRADAAQTLGLKWTSCLPANLTYTTNSIDIVKAGTSQALHIFSTFYKPGGMDATDDEEWLGFDHVAGRWKFTSSATLDALPAHPIDVSLNGGVLDLGSGGSATGITKAMVGLGNVDNTTDLGKPISTATQTALNLKNNALLTQGCGGPNVVRGFYAQTDLLHPNEIFCDVLNFSEVATKPTTLGGYGITDAIPLTYLDTDGTAAANSDAKVMSQKAVRTYVAATAGSASQPWGVHFGKEDFPGANEVLTRDPIPPVITTWTVATNCAGSRLASFTAATADSTFTFYKCTTAGFGTCSQFGSATIAAGAKAATFTCSAATFTGGTDSVVIYAPASVDTTMAKFAGDLVGTR